MELLISVKFNDETKANLMSVIGELKKCTRKGMFFDEQNLRLTLVNITTEDPDLRPIKKIVNELSLKPFTLKFKGLDRSRRDGGDIYWALADESEYLNGIYEKLCEILDEQGYEYDKKPFRPRVRLGCNVIARPNFEFGEFECEVNLIALEKYKHYNLRDRFKNIFERKF